MVLEPNDLWNVNVLPGRGEKGMHKTYEQGVILNLKEGVGGVGGVGGWVDGALVGGLGDNGN